MTDTLDTSSDHGIDDAHDEHAHHGPTDKQFITLFFILAAVTAAEVAVSYIDFGSADWLFLPLLLGMMVFKFFAVVLYFMHIKFDHSLFGRLFYIGLVLAAFVYAAALSTFQFFAG